MNVKIQIVDNYENMLKNVLIWQIYDHRPQATMISHCKERNVLACICYDDEEEKPQDTEVELYYDEERL